MTDQGTGGPPGLGVVAVPARIRHAVPSLTQPDASAQDETEEEIVGIRAAFAGWNVWRSDEGRWWASRKCPLRPSLWPDGYALTVTADDAGALCSAISTQPGEARASRDLKGGSG
jgi:hypothetical protein